MNKKQVSCFSCGIFILLFTTLFYQCKASLFSDKVVFIENGKIKLGFEEKTGKLILFNDIVSGYEFINKNVVIGLPWEICFNTDKTGLSYADEISPLKFSYSKLDALTLSLCWEDFGEMDKLRVNAEVTLDKSKAFSYWNISVEGLNGHELTSVTFPKIAGLNEMENEELVIPTWMGSLFAEPRKTLKRGSGKMEWIYPGALSSQVIAIYNPEKAGFYASCDDSLSFAKNFSLTFDSLNTLVYRMINYPSSDSSLVSYSPAYKSVIGCFSGDWLDVAEIYGEWAVQQRWVKESRMRNRLTPVWLENTALWVWNRGRSENVLQPAVELRKKLGLPVNVLWHWWHNCSYDNNFPEYLPPREGSKSFIHAIESARHSGVHSLVYMNAIQWGDASESWKSGKIEPYTVKDRRGNMLSHVYNIFTGNALINMCVGTEFWRNHYSSLCDSVVNIYRADGVYMDQTCLSRMCYDKKHGHAIGGGNYWVNSSGKMIKQIQSKDFGERQPVFTGEGSAENWLPYLDAFLTLEASRERYAGVGDAETIPFFQAVYHPYGITFGSYSSLVTPPYDELWPEEFAPEKAGQLLDEKFNKQFLMEQAKSFVWGIQTTIANYNSFLDTERKEEIDYLLNIARLRYESLKYLLYGKFLRPPRMEVPNGEIDISRLSIYAGRKDDNVTTFKKSVPLLYSGAWKADDGDLGIALASISDYTVPVEFTFNAEDYDLPPAGKIYIRTNEGKKLLGYYSEGIIEINIFLPSKALSIIEITQL